MNNETGGLPLSQLDQAHALRLRGQPEEALRLAASLAAAAPEHLGAAALLASLLLEGGRAPSAGQLAARLIDLLIQRGDLPGAWVAALLTQRAAGPGNEGLRRIAEAFGKGSPRLAGGSVRPPPLPAEIPVDPALAASSGPALLDLAEQAAARFARAGDAQPAAGPVPALPLFSTLEPERLLKLLGRMELRELDAGAAVLREGDEGREAFVIARGIVNVVREDGRAGALLLATLGPGAIFGEMALVSQAPRAASVVAVEPVQLLSIARSALEELAAEDAAIGRELGRFCYGRMISNLIRHSAILSSVPSDQRSALVERFTSERFEVGEYLVRQGEEASRLFLIASGEVQVQSRDEAGERTVLAQLGPGHVVGEISLVLRRPANADVLALHATVALALSREQFHEAIREHPTLLRELYDIAIQREQETRSVVAQRADDVSDVVLL
jgi:cAMP-dependent protein kinase regulator